MESSHVPQNAFCLLPAAFYLVLAAMHACEEGVPTIFSKIRRVGARSLAELGSWGGGWAADTAAGPLPKRPLKRGKGASNLAKP
jgi:hypothetical protein